ncbi:DUF1097 domain-containing protein [Actinomyces sp. AC-20-1]|nr:MULTISPECIES: DUF1097 domain-containing protein [unclassified Actinomyces]
MSSRQFIPIAVFTGVLGATVQVIDIIVHSWIPPDGNTGMAWIAFLAWATYFMSGGTARGGVKAFIGMTIGCLLALGILGLSGFIDFLGMWSGPVAIACLVPLTIMLERGPDISSAVAPVFIGAGAYFGLLGSYANAPRTHLLAGVLLYAVLGLVFGWMTVFGRKWYTDWIDDRVDSSAPATP